MAAPVLAVFSGTDVDQALFERALEVARSDGRPLILLDVRHQQQAERLSEYLESESLLGRGTVKALRRSVKQQRDRAIQRSLTAMVERAHALGIPVESRQEKGEYRESIRHTCQRTGAGVVVVSASAGSTDLDAEYTVLQV